MQFEWARTSVGGGGCWQGVEEDWKKQEAAAVIIFVLFCLLTYLNHLVSSRRLVILHFHPPAPS